MGCEKPWTSHGKELELYFEDVREILKNFRQKDRLSIFSFGEVHPGECVENAWQGSTDKAKRAGRRLLHKSQHKIMGSGGQLWQRK